MPRAVSYALAAGSTDEGIVAATRGTSVTHASGNKSEVPFGGLADARQAIFWTTRSRSGLVARGAVFRFGVGLISSFGRPRQDRTQRARCVRGGACPCTIGTVPVARPGKSSARAKVPPPHVVRGISCSGRFLFRVVVLPSSFRPRFPDPTSLRRTLLSASLAFQGASGFSRSGTFALLRPRPCWAPVSLTQFVAARSSVLRGGGAASWLCLFGWG